jgi:tRNA(Ile)-lysidine synthase
MELLSRVRRTIREHDLARAGTRVVAAVSGGPDSVALAHLLARLAGAGDLVLAGVAHFNHELRDTAARDEAFCRELAATLGVPFDAGRADVAALARSERRSIEHAAHDTRYRFFAECRERLGAEVVALGHTRDDQAETFLLRLVRGAGARGLAAMYPRHGIVVRPLLDCRRGDLAQWLDAQGIPFMVDESNVDVSIPRNRVRAELLPLLEARFNEAAVDVLADAAELARAEWDWLQQTADAVLAETAAIDRGCIAFDIGHLCGTPLAIRRLVIWRAMSRLTTLPVTFGHVQDVIRLLDGGVDGARLDAPGQTLQRVGDQLVLISSSPGKRREAPAPGAETNLFEYSLSIPGEVVVPEAHGLVIAEEVRAEPANPLSARGHEALIRRDLCGARLTVRNRRPGDRFRLLGLGGRKKLQDLFVDRKIARAARDRIPLVVDETGRILWVAGVGIAEEFRVTDLAQPMLILRFKVVGGPA